MDPTPRQRIVRRQRRRAILIVLLIPLGALAWLLFGPTPEVQDVPITFVRGPEGSFVRDGQPSGAWLELHAAKLEAQNSLTTSSSEIRTGECRLACRRVAVFAGSYHPLMVHAGHALAERLQGLPDVEEIHYYPLDQAPARGARAPDVWIQLGAEELEGSWVPFSRSVRATVTFRVAEELVESRPRVQDSRTPPVVQYALTGRLRHDSRTTGVVTASARYKLAAADIAGQLSKAIQEYLRGIRESDGPLPELPSSFYPEYREPPAIPLGPWFEPVLSVHGLMASSETLWSQVAPPDLEGLLRDLARRFEDEGWVVDSPRPEAEAIRDLRLTRDAMTLLVFPAESPAFSSSKGPVLFAKLVVRMTAEELERAVEATLRPSSPDELLFLFQRQWTPRQRVAVRDLLDQRPPTSPLGWISLARMRADDGDRTEAVEAVARAAALLRALREPGRLQDRLDDIAEELHAEDVARAAPSSQVLREVGFVEIELGAELPAREVSVDEPATWFLRREDRDVDVVTVRVTESVPPGGAPTPGLDYVLSQGRGSRSWGSGGLVWSTVLHSGLVLSVTARRIDGSDRFRLEPAVGAVAGER